MAYTVKSIKTFRGTDTNGFNATLLWEGKKVVLVIDEGGGAPMMFEWFDRAMPKVDVPWINWQGAAFTMRCSPEEARLYEFLRGKTVELNNFRGGTTTAAIDPEIFIGQLIDKATNDKRDKRACKTKTIFHLRSDPEGSWKQFNSPFNKRMKDHIISKYGDQVDEILNETLGQVAV